MCASSSCFLNQSLFFFQTHPSRNRIKAGIFLWIAEDHHVKKQEEIEDKWHSVKSQFSCELPKINTSKKSGTGWKIFTFQPGTPFHLWSLCPICINSGKSLYRYRDQSESKYWNNTFKIWLFFILVDLELNKKYIFI